MLGFVSSLIHYSIASCPILMLYQSALHILVKVSLLSKLRVVDFIHFPFLFYFHFPFDLCSIFLFLELRVRVRVTVTSYDMVIVTITSHMTHGKM